MDTSIFIALINPAMALIFAAAFFMLWHHQRGLHYIAVLGLGFLGLSGGFLLQYFSPLGIPASRIVSNLLFLGGATGIVIGALGRYGRQPPFAAIAIFAGLGMAGFGWFLFVDPDLSWRIYSMNFAFGAISLLLAFELRAVPDRAFIDNLLLGIIVFWGFMFFPRPIVVMWIDGPYENYENFHQSLYWMSLTFSASLFMLLFALSLITAIALDVMEELRRESQTDPLSGLLNRRGFEEGSNTAMKQARRKGMPSALVVCDLDHFKSVNDNFGHTCGDSVITTFADCLRTTLGGANLIGRIGGEEFAILVQGANLSTARLFAEGVRTAFGALPVPGLPGDMRFTASFGIAEMKVGETFADLFSRADEALYEAKKAGRDCVRVSSARSNADAAKILPVRLAAGGV